jgi:outer membrane scaffolding protein for murein synthesis (MipA/OmpV family)
MKKLVLSTSVVSSLLCLSAASAQTELKPQWEAGAGFAAIDFPMYRGSNERRSYLLPIPYFVYRGDTVQINRERVRGLIFKRDRVEMDISVNGTVPAKGAIARQGMPDLDPTLEVGPSLHVHLYHSEDRKTGFDVRMPVRGVVASDFKHVQPVGWLFQPQLDADFLDVDHSGWNIGLVGGLVFSDQRYNQYFYNVAPQYATAARPAYAVGGGYAGTQCIFAFSKRRQDGRWMGGFMKWDNLNGAVFADSPLVKTRQYFTVGFAVTWTLDKSDTMVEVHND